MILIGLIKQTWATINNMKALIFLSFVIFLTFLSCSDQQNSPMNKVVIENYASFNLQTLNDSYLNLDELRGSYILINFWATWCKPCVKEIPSLNNLNNKFKNNDNFKLIAINIGQNKDVVNKFVKNMAPIDFIILLDESMELTDWNVKAIPTTFLLNDKGKIIYKVEGERKWDSPEFISFINSIIN